jgi:hypothetical protein
MQAQMPFDFYSPNAPVPEPPGWVTPVWHPVKYLVQVETATATDGEDTYTAQKIFTYDRRLGGLPERTGSTDAEWDFVNGLFGSVTDETANETLFTRTYDNGAYTLELQSPVSWGEQSQIAMDFLIEMIESNGTNGFCRPFKISCKYQDVGGEITVDRIFGAADEGRYINGVFVPGVNHVRWVPYASDPDQWTFYNIVVDNQMWAAEEYPSSIVIDAATGYGIRGGGSAVVCSVCCVSVGVGQLYDCSTTTFPQYAEFNGGNGEFGLANCVYENLGETGPFVMLLTPLGPGYLGYGGPIAFAQYTGRVVGGCCP